MGERAVQTEYYSLLNVSPTATEEEIQNAYRRLALTWHPDRHSPELREAATVKFSRLQQVLEVLSDPKKRRVYDAFGEDGLSSGLEVGAHFKTPEAMRAEFERLAAKQAQKRIEAKMPTRGVVETKISVVDMIAGRSIGGAQFHSLGVHHSLEANLSSQDSATVSAHVVSQKGFGAKSVGCSLRHQMLDSGFFEVTGRVGQDTAMTATLQRRLSTHSSGTLRAELGNQPEFSCNCSRQLTENSSAKIGYSIGHFNGVKLRFVSSLVGNAIDTNVRIAAGFLEWTAKAQKQLSQRSTVFATTRISSENRLSFESGISRRVSGHSTIGCSVYADSDGVGFKLQVSRLGQSFVVPMLMANNITPTVVAASMSAQITFCALLKYLVMVPTQKRRKQRRLQRMREEHAAATESARREAAADVDLMKATVSRRRGQEEDRGGLVVLKATYGHFVGTLGGLDDPQTSQIIDVTTPLQFLVENSKLQLFSSNKSGLPGFYDIAVGESKRLYVLYRFKGKLHETVVDDADPLVIPLQRDALPNTARRNW